MALIPVDAPWAPTWHPRQEAASTLCASADGDAPAAPDARPGPRRGRESGSGSREIIRGAASATSLSGRRPGEPRFAGMWRPDRPPARRSSGYVNFLHPKPAPIPAGLPRRLAGVGRS
jgi:hypothetical protein